MPAIRGHRGGRPAVNWGLFTGAALCVVFWALVAALVVTLVV